MTLTLRQPQDGTVRIVRTNTRTRATLGGTTEQVRPVTWPESNAYRFEFTGITQAKKDEALTYFCDNAGKEVTIDDIDGNMFVGIIVDNIEIEQTHAAKEGVTCALYSMSFNFEGNAI